MKKLKKIVSIHHNQGITLIALVITIVVLLILAGVTIAMVVGDNGMLTRAKEAKTEEKIGEEKEKIQIAVAAAKIGDDGIAELTQENLKKELNKTIGEIGTYYSLEETDDNFTVTYRLSNRSYKIYKDGNIIENGTNPRRWRYKF